VKVREEKDGDGGERNEDEDWRLEGRRR